MIPYYENQLLGFYINQIVVLLKEENTKTTKEIQIDLGSTYWDGSKTNKKNGRNLLEES